MKPSRSDAGKLGTIAHYIGVAAEYCLVICLAAWLSHALPVPRLLGFPYRVVGLALTAVGSILIAWCCWLQFTVGQGTTGFSEPTKRLVTSGPYRLVRNPMMEGQFLFFAGLGLFLDLGAMFLLLPIIILATHAVTVFIEEPKLESRFGQEWVDYPSRVPRWLPRLGKVEEGSQADRS